MYMPNQQGVETIQRFRRLFPEVPIIAISGRAAAETMLSVAQKLGAVDGLQKLFIPEPVVAAVNRALESKA